MTNDDQGLQRLHRAQTATDVKRRITARNHGAVSDSRKPVDSLPTPSR